MAFIIGPGDDAYGEPSRTFLRHTFLYALREEVPGIQPDLWEYCIGPARAVLATGGPNDRAEHLFDLLCVREANKHLADRALFRARNTARAELWEELVPWAVGYRLTDDTGTDNGWLLKVALKTLRGWCEQYPAERYPVNAPDGLDWRLPGASTVGDLSYPAPELRQRKHTEPAPESKLGPLARDWVWLVNYVCTPYRKRTDFAPGVERSTVVQRVQAAADRIGFDLPAVLRPRTEAD